MGFWLALGAAPPTPSPQIQSLSPLLGTWQCAGVFPASGRKIASTIRFESDLGGVAMLKHHDDDAGLGTYHAIEVWTFDAKGSRLVDTIADNYGGVRTFASPGWVDNTLTLTNVVRPEQFVYTRLEDGELRVDYRVARDGSTYAVGDTLTCKLTKSEP
jgi:hypothetical protein